MWGVLKGLKKSTSDGWTGINLHFGRLQEPINSRQYSLILSYHVSTIIPEKRMRDSRNLE